MDEFRWLIYFEIKCQFECLIVIRDKKDKSKQNILPLFQSKKDSTLSKVVMTQKEFKKIFQNNELDTIYEFHFYSDVK